MIAVKYPLLLLAVASTVVVGSLTGISVSAFAAGSPSSGTTVVSSVPLTVPEGYQPIRSAPAVTASPGVVIVSVAAPIAISPELDAPAATVVGPAVSSAADSAQAPATAPAPLVPAPLPPAVATAPPQGDGKKSDVAKGNGKGNQSQNGNGKGRGNGGPAGSDG